MEDWNKDKEADLSVYSSNMPMDGQPENNPKEGRVQQSVLEAPRLSVSEKGKQRRDEISQKIGPTLSKIKGWGIKWGTKAFDVSIGATEMAVDSLRQKKMGETAKRLGKELFSGKKKLKDDFSKIAGNIDFAAGKLVQQGEILGYRGAIALTKSAVAFLEAQKKEVEEMNKKSVSEMIMDASSVREKAGLMDSDANIAKRKISVIGILRKKFDFFSDSDNPNQTI
jgi:hypothetical protein